MVFLCNCSTLEAKGQILGLDYASQALSHKADVSV